MNPKVNKERPGSTFKMPSRTKQCNAQGSIKPLQRTYSIESMDSDTDRIVASLNLEEIINNLNIRNQLTEGKFISLLTFSNVNLILIHIYLNVLEQMTDIKLLLLHSNSYDNLTVCKQMSKSK